jgi:hypothetical protein
MLIANSSRLEMEDAWRKRLMVARDRYDRAVAQSHRALEDRGNWPLQASDKSSAVREARQQESAARKEYMRVLTAFTNLTVFGKMPEEP